MRSFVWTILCFIMLGCGKMEVYPDGYPGNLKEDLSYYKDKGITVDSAVEKDGVCRISFSNGDQVGIELSDIPVVTIDIRGNWLLNGAMTEFTLERDGIEVLMSAGSDGDLIGVVEGYTDYSFCFRDNTRIVLTKSLFSTDPDSVIRGVNHRGYNAEAPENTLPAYRLSKLKGFKYVETDINFTSDNVPVLIHDNTVDRTSNGVGAVKDMTWDEISKLDFGKWKSSDYFRPTGIPSLAEFLTLCRDLDLYPYLELKTGTKQQVESVLDMVEEYGMNGKVAYISFLPTLLKYVIAKDPGAAVGLLVKSPLTDAVVDTALGLMTGSNYVFIDSSDYSAVTVDQCRKASLPLEVWVINSENVIKSLSPYISGVASDRLHAGRIIVRAE